MNKNIVEEIKDKLDIVELIRQYVPGLKRAGRTYKACCPFHKEKTPSFTCSSEKGLFYCFGCQEGGDIFAFLMKMEHLSFNEAVQKLADMAGIEYRPQKTLTAEEIRRGEIRKVLDFARGYYHKQFLAAQGEPARTYAKKRGLTKETCQKFELGFAQGTGTDLARAVQTNRYTPSIAEEAGLCKNTAYGLRDYFRNRLIFPIINQRGDTVGFGGRILGEGEPKYLNSPETVLFTKSRVLYGLNFAGPEIRKAGRAVLLEGYMDVIGTHQAGIGYTVAPLGTSLTEEHARLLKRYTDNVVVLFDPDEAGTKASLRGALILISQGLFVKVASLPEGLDPDEFILKYGCEKFEEILDHAEELIAFHTRAELAKYPKPLSAQDKTALVSELAQTLEKQPDEIVRREWAKYVAEQTGVEEQLVLARLRQIRQSDGKNTIVSAKMSGLTPVHSAEDDLFAWILKSPQHIVLCAELTEQDFSTQAKWALFQAIVKAHVEQPEAADITTLAGKYAVGQEKELIRLSLLPVPTDFDPARDIATCAGKLAVNGLNKQMAQIKRQMKQYGTGNVPAEVFQKYVQLQKKLKKYRL